MTKSHKHIFINQGDIIQSCFKLVSDLIHVHLICKFYKDLLKTERLMLMRNSKGGFFQQSRIKNVVAITSEIVSEIVPFH